MPDGNPPQNPAPSSPPSDNPERKPWDKLPGESDHWYSAFLTYLNLGKQNRSLQEAYTIFNGGRMTIMSGPFGENASRWQWVARAKAYDVFAELQITRAREDAAAAEAEKIGQQSARDEWDERRDTVRKQGWELAQSLIAKAKEMLSVAVMREKRVPADAERGRPAELHLHPCRWSFFTICQMVETADKLQRMACELPVTIADVNKGANEQGADAEPMFAHTAGQLEQALPEGVVPAMPENVATLPAISIGRETTARGMRQPHRARPGPRRGTPPPG